MRRLLALALLLSGCGTTYVPVAVGVSMPKEPAECRASVVKASAMKPFDKSKVWTALDIHAAWVKHEIEVRAATRKTESNQRVCWRFRRSLEQAQEGAVGQIGAGP